MTMYNFQVDPRVLYLFIDDLTEDRYNNYVQEFDKFIFKYSNDRESKLFGLFKVLTGESENNQMLVRGVKDGEESTVAYWFVGEEVCDYSSKEDIEEFEKAMVALHKIKKEYKIK